MNILWKLMVTFFQIGLFSIGGGYAIIPLIQSEVVERYGWVSERVFTDIITISQMTPGPLAVNTSTFIGLQIAGIVGAILATVGCVISGIVIATFLYRFFQKHHASKMVMKVLDGLRASSLGLIVSAAGTILLLALLPDGKHLDFMASIVFVFSLFALRKWKVNPILLMIVTGVIGIFIYV